MSPRKKSSVWNFFTKDTASATATCKFCFKKLKTSGNTSNLIGHLERIHGKHIKNNEEPSTEDRSRPSSSNSFSSCASTSTCTVSSVNTHTDEESKDSHVNVNIKQGLITSAFAHIEEFKPGGKKDKEITRHILCMIVQDNLPLSFVESEAFKRLLHLLAPQYKLPSRRTLTRMLDVQYNVQANNFKEKILNMDNYTITTDIWTDCHQTKSYLGITLHYLENSDLASSTIGVYPLEERHTAAYISEVLETSLSDWNVDKRKVLAVLTDNGQNIVKATSDTFGSNKHVPCFAHTINLVAENSIKAVPTVLELINKVKNIVTWFKQSVVAADCLRKAQRESGILEHNVLKLIQSVDTRWNSKYYMLERFLQLHKFINSILINEKTRTAPDVIPGFEIDILDKLKNLLHPLEMVTKELSGDKYVTISKIIPIVHCMKKGIEKVQVNNQELQDLKRKLEEEINKRFGKAEKVERLAVATILDPRFKKIHFNDITAAANAILCIRKKLEKSCNIVITTEETKTNDEPDPDQPIGNDDSLWEHHTNLVSQLQTQIITNKDDTTNILNSEVSQYVNSSLFSLSKNPFLIWEEIKLTYPHLYKLAIEYLQIPATSVPAERLFSKTGQILNELRSRIKPNRLNQLLFLSSINIKDWIV